MGIIRAWGAFTRYLIFSAQTAQAKSAARTSAVSALPKNQAAVGTSAAVQQAAIAEGVTVPEMWVKRYYVPYDGRQHRIRFCVHIDSGVAEKEEFPLPTHSEAGVRTPKKKKTPQVRVLACAI